MKKNEITDVKVYLLLAMVGLILIVSIIQSFQIRELKAKALTVSAGAVSGALGSLDMTGWTEDEKMMYEHHGTVPDRLKSKVSSATASASSGSGMVGGC